MHHTTDSTCKQLAIRDLSQLARPEAEPLAEQAKVQRLIDCTHSLRMRVTCHLYFVHVLNLLLSGFPFALFTCSKHHCLGLRFWAPLLSPASAICKPSSTNTQSPASMTSLTLLFPAATLIHSPSRLWYEVSAWEYNLLSFLSLMWAGLHLRMGFGNEIETTSWSTCPITKLAR